MSRHRGALKLRMGVGRQRRLDDEGITLLAEDSEQPSDAKIEVVVGLDFRRLLIQQNGRSAAEGFEVDAMLGKEFDDAGCEIVLAAMPFDR